MIKLLGTSAFLAIALAATPASAQILGGGGGLGGGLGGSLSGGGLGGNITGSGMGTLGSTIDAPMRRVPSTSDTTGTLRGSSHTEKNVDARKGRVRASNDSSLDSAVANSTRIGDRTIGGSGSASGNAGGGADAQLIGTEAVRGTASNAVGRTRDTVSNVRDRAGTATSRIRDTVPTANDVSAAASGSANAAGALGSGTLALAGSAAANGGGAFPVSVGMPVTDAKGKLIGTVQSVRTAGRGEVERVLVKVKDKTATLPAANFSGSGNVLVSAMGKGEVRKASE